MNFSFLHPFFLWGLPLALGPVILHWLTRPRPKPLLFSSIELLRLSLQARLYRSRIKNWLLLLARCALLAALVMLFSRPVVHWAEGPGAGGDTMALVLVMDVSYSMEARAAGQSTLERAKEQAVLFLNGGDRKDRVGLVAVSDRVESSVPLSDNPAKARETLERLPATARPTRIWPGLETAYQMLAADPGPQKAIVVFSDLAENGWKDPAPSLRHFDPAVRVVLAEAGPAQGNTEIFWTRVRAEGSPERLKGAFGVRTWGKLSRPDRTWRVSVQDRVAAQGQFQLSPGDAQASLDAPARLGSLSLGEIALDADALNLDDRFYFPVQRNPAFSVLVVNGSPGLSPVQDEAYYLAPVLDSLAKAGSLVRTVPQQDAAREDLGSWDIVVMLNPGPLDPEFQKRLDAHLGRGGGLWITGGDNLPASRDTVESFLPGRAGSVAVLGEPLRLEEPGASSSGGTRAAGLARALSEEGGFEWSKAVVDKAVDAAPGPGAQVVLASGRSGRPLLIVGRVKGGLAAFWAATVDRDWTNLPAKPAFPVLCRQLLMFLAGRTGAAPGLSLVVDQPFEGALSEPLTGSVDIERPDGASETVPARAGRVLYSKTDAPGLYKIRGRGARSAGSVAGQDVLGFFVVNLDRDAGEGNLARVVEDVVRQRLPARDLVWVPHPEPVLKKFQERVRGKDLTPLLASAAALLFGLESFLTLAGVRRS